MRERAFISYVSSCKRAEKYTAIYYIAFKIFRCSAGQCEFSIFRVIKQA